MYNTDIYQFAFGEIGRGVLIFMDQKRIYYFDNLKGVLILLVVAGHFIEHSWSVYTGHLSLWIMLWTCIYSFHMPAFSMVSGYFLGKSSRNPLKKIPKVLFLYFLSCLLYTLRNVYHGKRFRLRPEIPRYGMWYLLFLAYAYVLVLLLRKLRAWIAISLAFLAALAAGFFPQIAGNWGIGQTFFFMPYLIIGFYAPLDHIALLSRKHRKIVLPLFLLCMAGLSVFTKVPGFSRSFFRGSDSAYLVLFDDAWKGLLVRSCVYLLGLFLIFLLLGLIPEKKTPFALVGRHTLLILMVHTYFLRNILPEFTTIPWIQALPYFVQLFLLAILIFVVCVLFSFLQYQIRGERD